MHCLVHLSSLSSNLKQNQVTNFILVLQGTSKVLVSPGFEFCTLRFHEKVHVKMRLSSFQKNLNAILASNKLEANAGIHIQSSLNEKILVTRHTCGDIVCESLSYPIFTTSPQAILNELNLYFESDIAIRVFTAVIERYEVASSR
jgi:hypothetical protein